MSTVNYPTQEQLKYNFQTYLQGDNSAIDAFATNSSWDILAGAQSLQMLNLYANLQLVENAIYPQNSAGYQCDSLLYARGLPGRGNTTFATIICIFNGATPAIITAGTMFTSSETGAQFIALSTIAVSATNQSFMLYSNSAGGGYLESAGNTLTAGSQTVGVTSSTDGQNQESEQSCINRILSFDRQPSAGGRETDYQNYALQYNATLSNSVITDSIPILGFSEVNNVSVFGLFIVGGNAAISEYQLNLGLLPSSNFVGYSRQLGTSTVTGLNNYIQSLRLVGLPIVVGSCVTATVTASTAQLSIGVSLVSGYDLDTLITINSQDNNDNPISIQLTVQQLIQREARRAICNQVYGATLINGVNYITIDSIRYQINTQLSAANGQLAQLLTNLNITNGDIVVPAGTSAVDPSNVHFVYDVDSYDDIIVNQV